MRRFSALSRITLLLLLVVALLPLPIPAAPTAAQQPDDPIEAIIASWTPKERVGQLMLVTFESSSLRPDTAIAQLIAEYNVGGVVLLAENDNINGQVNTPRLVQSLTTDLQQLAYDSAQATQERTTPRTFVPLFITTTHAGNGQPDTQIAQDTTPLPSQLAIGATWNTGYARQVGQIAGIELSAMGINMLLGPRLSIAQQQTEQSIDLGVHTFGGEPNWVGQMGADYVTGVHMGSQGRIAVIAQDFPGLGFADTQPDQEIPVVPRSVDQLSDFDLLPFDAVTGAAGETLARADGLQCANIRYQGDTMRSITGPVCVDEEAFATLLNLDYFSTWRRTGILISSPLGTRAIRRYYRSPFPHRQVAREAFLAGNDLLYLSDFGTTPTEDQFDNVADVIDFFAERYEDDPVFRARVNVSLRRILRLKLDLYNDDLSLSNVQLPVNEVNLVGGYTAELYNIAEQAVTLLAPRRESLPPPPGRDDSIVIFTDVRLVQQCSYCATYPLVTVNALESAVERLYGPYADAQIRPEQVVSFSFSQLQGYLAGDVAGVGSEDGQLKTNQRIGEALRDVDWIVFVMLDVDPAVPESQIVRHLLESESTMVGRASVAVIALGAPTYLSSTEVSKFDAYFGLYSHTQPFIDAAARALFQDSSFPGMPPISVPAVGYDVLVRTSPNPTQILKIDLVSINGYTLLDPVANTDILPVQIGDRLELRTYPILDRNGHIVPDNTPVEFTITFITDNLQTRQPAVTQSGIAYTTLTPTRPGRIQVTLSSEEATTSTTFQINVLEAGSDAAANSAPASAETASARPPFVERPDDDDSAGPVAAADETPPAQADAAANASPGTPMPSGSTAAPRDDTARRRLDAVDFVLSLFALALMSIGGFTQGRALTRTSAGGIRVVLGSVVAGLTGYIYYGVDGPGMSVLYTQFHNLAPLVITGLAGLIGSVVAWWMLRHDYP